MRRHSWLVWLVMFVSIPTVSAKSQIRGTDIPIALNSAVAFNPVLLPLGSPMIELETGVGAGFTLGGVASYTNLTDRYTSIEAKLRYYPGKVVLQGFSMGLTAGWLRFSTDNHDTRVSSGTLSAPTVGIIADHNWLLGRSRQFLVGTGLGAKYWLASERDRAALYLQPRGNPLGSAKYINVRFVVGYAF